MKKTLRIAVAIASVLVAMLIVSMFILRIGQARTSGERSSGAEYSILRNVFIGIQNQGDLQDTFIRNRLIAIYKDSERLLASQVLDRSGMVVWKIPADSPYFALPNDPSSRAGFAAPESSTVIFSTPLNDGMKLLALYTSLRRSDISSAIKPSLILAFVWLLLSCVALILLSRDGASPNRKTIVRSLDAKPNDKASSGKENSPSPLAPEKPSTSAPAPEQQATAPSATADTRDNTYAAAAEKIDESQDNDDDQFFEDQDLMEEDAEKENEESRDTEANGEEIDEFLDAEEAIEILESEKPLPDPEVKKEEQPAPKDGVKPSNKNFEESLTKLEKEIALWTARQREPKPAPVEIQETDIIEKAQPVIAEPEKKAEVTNQIAPEKADLRQLPMPLSLQDSALERKLSEELLRNVSDIALMLIHCSIGSPGDPIAIAMSVTIKDYIGSKDLVFELYRGAYAIVLPSVDLGGALKMSEDLADVLATTFSLYKDVEESAPIFIGISARSNRKIDSYKIYREASTAVHKAFSGGRSRILAFRAKA
jgi:hypothetical protein